MIGAQGAVQVKEDRFVGARQHVSGRQDVTMLTVSLSGETFLFEPQRRRGRRAFFDSLCVLCVSAVRFCFLNRGGAEDAEFFKTLSACGEALFLQAQDHSANAVFERYYMEVDQQAYFPSAQPHVSQELRFVDWKQRLHCLNFYNDEGAHQ